MRFDSPSRTTVLATAAGIGAVHATRLACSLFLEYLSSPNFGRDCADALANYENIFGFFESGFDFPTLASRYSATLGMRMVYRLTECGVSALCAFSSSPFLQGAVAFHYLYPTVQEYRLARWWLARALRLLTSWAVPRFLRAARIDPEEDPDGAYLQNPPSPSAALHAHKASLSSSSSGASLGSSNNSSREGIPASEAKEAAFYAREEAVFSTMPDVCAATLRYYVYSYKAAPFRTILQAGFIPDLSRWLVELGQWSAIIVEEREKQTSRWRVLKRFIPDQISTLTQITLSYSIRYVAAKVAMKLFREPTGGAIFWTEHILHFVFAYQIMFASRVVGARVYTYIDAIHPPTNEDVEEDEKADNEEREAAARADSWTRMATDAFAAGPGGLGGGAANNSSTSSNAGNNGVVDFYSVLAVSDSASQAEIKKAYRQLALQNHPDRVGRDVQAQQTARDRMAIINEAYDILMDRGKKAQYDGRRRMANAPNFVDKLEKLSTPQLVGLTAGLATLTGVAGYAHFIAVYQRITASGCGPLSMFASRF